MATFISVKTLKLFFLLLFVLYISLETYEDAIKAKNISKQGTFCKWEHNCQVGEWTQPDCNDVVTDPRDLLL